MIIRVQTNIGQWRVSQVTAESTGQDLLNEITKTRPNISFTKSLSIDRSYKQQLDVNKSLKEQNLSHGSMVYCMVDESSAVSASTGDSTNNDGSTNSSTAEGNPKHMKRIIGKDGSISLVHDDNPSSSGSGTDKSFRKGMLPLRDMKMSWTLKEFVAMDDQFNFKIQRQKESWVGEGGVSVDQESANAFQSYLRTFAFQRQRFGFLYGKFVNEEEKEEDKYPKREVLFGTELPGTEIKKEVKNKKVIVEAIYEPPQVACPDSPEGFIVLDDPNEEKVDLLASMLGLTKVGWIFGHPPREKGFQMSASEIIMAAEMQLECAGGIEPTPFVTVKVTVGDDGNVSFEAFQVSKQCMEMVAEEALQVGENPGYCYVSDTFTAIQEGKASKTVENNFFLTVVPIVQHVSETFVSQFPKANRDHDTRQQTHDEMKKQLSKSGSAGWTFVDLLADFNLLIYLCNYLDLQGDLQKICQSIVDRDIPLDEGYKLIIASMAGLDNAY